MAEDVIQNIVINAVGGDGAAAQIDQVNKSFQMVNATHDEMKGKFQERFQHIGLMLFAGDALRASGLGRETRMVVSTLNLAMNEASVAAGIGSGGIMLLVAAMVALVGIGAKVIGHHKSNIEILNKEIEANDKQMESLNKSTGAMEEYVKAGGHLTTAQETFLAASKQVADNIRGDQIDALQKAIGALEANRQKIIDHAQMLAVWRTYLADAMVVWTFLVDRVKEALSPFDAIGNAISKVSNATGNWVKEHLALGNATAMAGSDLKHLNEALDKNTQSLDEDRMKLEALRKSYSLDFAQMTKDIQEHGKEIDKQKLANDQLAEHFATGIKHMADMQSKYNAEMVRDNETSFIKKNQAVEKWAAQQQTELNRVYNSELNYLNHSKADTETVTAQKMALQKQYHDSTVALHEDAANKITTAEGKAWDDFKTKVKETSKSIENEFGTAVAQMIVEGKNFSDSMDKIMKNMAEKFIEDVIGMVIEWLALRAVMSIWPGGAAAYQGVAQAAYPAVAQGAYASLGNKASGGTFYADQPTTAVFGEAGPEMATFTPMGGGGASSGGGGGGGVGTVNINLSVGSIQGNDPQGTLEMLASEIRRETATARQFSATVAGVAARYPKQAY